MKEIDILRGVIKKELQEIYVIKRELKCRCQCLNEHYQNQTLIGK